MARMSEQEIRDIIDQLGEIVSKLTANGLSSISESGSPD